jgi:hypothetical protein
LSSGGSGHLLPQAPESSFSHNILRGLFVVPTFTKYSKNLKRDHSVTTSDPREAAQLRAQGYREVQPKKRQEPSSKVSQQSDKKTSK